MPIEDERKNLIRERDYLKDRLSEISDELNRMSLESSGLKREMEAATTPDAARLKAIRRRRLYLGRYSDDLKVERQRITIEHSRLTSKLAGDSTTTDPGKEQ